MAASSGICQRFVGARRGLGHKAVADVADRPDEHLMFQAKLGAQTSHMDVHRPGPSEVVVAPHLLEKLGSGEYPAGVLGEMFDQLELLVRQVEQSSADPCRVGGLVDDKI